MRAAALGSLTASVLVAATLAVTAPTAASASAAPDDWRSAVTVTEGRSSRRSASRLVTV